MGSTKKATASRKRTKPQDMRMAGEKVTQVSLRLPSLGRFTSYRYRLRFTSYFERIFKVYMLRPYFSRKRLKRCKQAVLFRLSHKLRGVCLPAPER